MSFIREKRVGKYTYLQLVESYWDSVAKKRRQRYIRSLGRVDEYQIEPGEAVADKHMQRWVEQGGPERLEQERAEQEAAQFDPNRFLAETQGAPEADIAGSEDGAPDKDSNGDQGSNENDGGYNV